MKLDLSRQIERLKKQVNEIESLSERPRDLETALLETFSELLAILDEVQNGYHAEAEVAQGENHIDLQHLLQSLEDVLDGWQERELLYRHIVESQVELICRFTPEGVLTFYNEAFYHYFSEFGDISLGQDLLDLIPKNSHTFTHHFTSILHPALPVTQFEYSLLKPSGEILWQHWTGLGNFNEDGLLVEIQAVGRDITDRKQAELATEQHTRELSALHTATATLLTTLDSDILLGRILDSAISAIPATKKGAIYLVAQGTGQLEMRATATTGTSDARIQRISPTGSVGYISKAVHEKSPQLVRDPHLDPTSFAGQPAAHKDIQSAIVVPLILKKQVLGVISLESNQPEAFNESDLRLLSSFAATATAALHNARLHGEVQMLAITDALTGLYNRRGFFELGQREVERSRRFNRPLVAIMLDVDRFKFINDTYGHATGDHVLQAVANLCLENLRRIDILGRFGGDEFTILLPETDIYRARGIAERLRQNIAASPLQVGGDLIEVTISLGIARATSATPDLDVLISRADAAMYLAKQAGRNRVEFG